MRTLALMRHAKSSWPDDDTPDLERPLSGRGKRAAVEMGGRLLARGLVPDVVVTSPAKRARSTAKRLLAAWPGQVQRTVSDDLYATGPAEYLAVCAALPAEAQRALLVGHNPAMEDTLAALTGERRSLKAGAVAIVELDVETWREVQPGTRGRLVALYVPSDAEGDGPSQG